MYYNAKFCELIATLEALVETLHRKRCFLPYDWLFILEDVNNKLHSLCREELRDFASKNLSKKDISCRIHNLRKASLRLSSLIGLCGFGLTGKMLCAAIEGIGGDIRAHLRARNDEFHSKTC